MYFPIEMKCDDCNEIWEYNKESIMASTPTDLPCPKCESLNTHRSWGIGAIDIAEGKFGNSKNNYQQGVIYHPSTMMGKVKGTKVK